MNGKMFSLKRIILITLAVTLLAITLGYYRLEFDKISRIREAITKSEKELEEKRRLSTEKTKTELKIIALDATLKSKREELKEANPDEELKCVARALLPEDISEGLRLAYEMFQYSIAD